MSVASADAVVIGAGAAGLAAARKLTAAGLRVVVLEARPHAGGRIFTVHESGLAGPVELGAEFVHGKPPETRGIADAGIISLYDVTGEEFRARQGRIEPMGDFHAEIGRVLDRLDRVPPEDESFSEFLANRCADLPAESRELAAAYVEGFDAAPADRASALALAAESRAAEEIEGSAAFRILGGYNRLVRWLIAGLEPVRFVLRPSTIVRAVRFRRGEVEVEVETASPEGHPLEPVRAARAVVTVPLGVLAASPGEPGAIRFEPELPEKRDAIRRLAMGSVIKVILRFRERFWEEGRFPPGAGGVDLFRLGFLHTTDRWFPTWWTQAPLRSPLLTAWAGAGSAAQLALEGDEAIVGRAVESLAAILGIGRGRVEGLLSSAYHHPWHHDPFSRGAYSYVPLGGLGAREALARPVEGTLFFAGEATRHDGVSGTVDAALASGYRAAEELLEARR